MKHYFILSICLLLFIATYAQSPQSFQYQAVVRDVDGNAVVSQPVIFRLSIISGALPGTIVYVESHNTSTNPFGIATLSVGSGIPEIGTFSGILWSSAIHFIKIEADLGGGYLDMGTTQLISVPYALYSENAGNVGDTLWNLNGNDIYNKNSRNVGIGTTTPPGKLVVQGDSLASDTLPLFEVKDKKGNTVFVVYQDSVHVFVKEGNGIKSNQGGFAVSGRNNSKASIINDYLLVTPDSVRVYINENGGAKSNKGGFAVSGRNNAKGISEYYLNVSVDTSEIINPSQNRILWYPTKSAFLTGKVLIESPDSVGTNSFATGYESKAIGDQSQALGYKPIARGNYSTAIGYNAISKGHNSYAFGNYAYSEDSASYAIGSGAKAQGLRCFAIGSSGIDSAGTATNPTIASGDYSYAFGMGSQAMGKGAFALGIQDTALGYYSLATGYQTKANNWYATAMGKITKASGESSTAIGFSSLASGKYSTALGALVTASGFSSTAIGYSSKATGSYSVAIGRYNTASGSISTTLGELNTASGLYSTAMGYINKASGDYSTAFGRGVIAKPYASFVIGRNNDSTCSATGMTNWIATDPLFIIGNGASASTRANAMTVLKNGETYLPVVYNSTVGVTNRDLYIDNTGKLGYVVSSVRYKKNISDMENIDWLYKLRPVNYVYKNDDLNIKQYGLIAEEVEKINPLFVSYNNEGTVETVKYSDFITPLLKAIQSQQTEIEILKNKVTEFENLKAEIEKIKKYQSNNQ